MAALLTMVLATLIGGSLGILGSGGSIVTFPVLVYVAGVPAKQAVGMSMAIVGATALFGALIQLRRGNLAVKAALIFSISGMLGAYIGSAGTHLLSKQALLLLFAAIMLIVGAMMLRGGAHLHRGRECSLPICLGVGFAVGVLTGFLGVGGGFLIVPALVLAAGLDTRLAAGTSLAVIALNSATGLIGQLRYVTCDWSLLGKFLLFAFVGMGIGIAAARRIHDDHLRRIFGGALIVVAVVIAGLNLKA
ncbi:MAG TPA: sulfite exporter TauE/SafE family protein [Bryobacteraceae bacterium]|nr:sulfite exporter TauE/SafE family protein [Bryobacteraceae bacterium]